MERRGPFGAASPETVGAWRCAPVKTHSPGPSQQGALRCANRGPQAVRRMRGGGRWAQNRLPHVVPCARPPRGWRGGGRGGQRWGFAKLKAEGACVGELGPTKPFPGCGVPGLALAFKCGGLGPVPVGVGVTGWRGQRLRPPRGGSELETGVRAPAGRHTGPPRAVSRGDQKPPAGTQTPASDRADSRAGRAGDGPEEPRASRAGPERERGPVNQNAKAQEWGSSDGHGARPARLRVAQAGRREVMLADGSSCDTDTRESVRAHLNT